MYPDWPETAADLVPQPLCPGPKLHAFDFKGPQDIQFLTYLGDGLHSHVVKVAIKGQEYALKLFRFTNDDNWLGPGEWRANETRAKLTALAQYSEPFNAECRAFGRLHEAGYPELALPCYGYILLDEENERRLQDKFNLEFNGDSEYSEEDMRGRFLGEQSGKPPPIRCILKAFGYTHSRDDQTTNFPVPLVRRLIRETTQLQQLGIFYHDMRLENLVNDKLGDFSTAITVPHFLTNPELNPHLSAEQIADLERETFSRTINDYWNFIEMFCHMEDNPGQRSKLREKVPVLPGFRVASNSKRLALRDTPRRKLERQRVHTKVDPRRYDWKAAAAAAETRGVGKRHKRKTLPAMPDPWYLDCTLEMAAKLNRQREHYEVSVVITGTESSA
ncbi:hypothetical protein SCUCBS95973_006433 [Sporothrix curviconia]|uniref:Protein kinase domain-containing protein n=1 Tax=Sporothrix curviconia TaxID=1260050 RepID=A0ABP0C777_9PEZI